MTRFIFALGATALAITVAANNATAQSVTQQAGVVGASGQEVYTLQVTGADGVTYNCRPDIQNVNGTPTRFCQRTPGAVQTLQYGSLTQPVGAAALGLAAVALIISGDGSSSTTTTN